jgi:hypothetical protein
MNSTFAYATTGIIALIIILAIIFVVRGRNREKKLTKLAALSFGFVIAGIIFNENRFVGYGLIGTGALLAIIDIIKKLSIKNERDGNNYR